jgi:hypothetical protein
MTDLQRLIALQKKEGWTDEEMGIFLEIPTNTWKTWKNNRRKPRGPSLTIIKWALLALKGHPITRYQLLGKTGRIGGLTPETLKEIRGLE